MNYAASVTIVYGAMVLLGGIFGMAQSGSVVSLATGGLFGLLAVAGGLGLARGAGWGWPLSVGVAAVVGVFFVTRLLGGAGFFPAGLTLILSAVAVAALLMGRPGARAAKG